MAQKTIGKLRHARVGFNWLSFLCASALGLAAAGPVCAQSYADVHVITPQQPILLAQVPSPGILPTDATKVNTLNDQAVVYPGVKLRIFQKLPSRMWIQGSTEVTQRLDTNVFLNYKKPQPDYVFRAAPNLTVGYNILDQTSVYAQYFVIKDCYTVHHRPLTEPTTQSIAMGLRHYLRPRFGGRMSTYLDIQARELFQSKGLRQADLTPSVNVQYFATQHLSFFGSVTLQMRGRQLFTGPQRELDPFYTLSMYYRRGPWAFSVSDTFVTNLREPFFTYSVPAHGNVNMIADFEVDRQIYKFQGLQAFVRAEPVFNWRSANAVGLSGFDFRLYSGLRLSFYKPSLIASIHQMQKAIQQQDPDAQKANAKGKKKGKGAPSGVPIDPTHPEGQVNAPDGTGGSGGGSSSPTNGTPGTPPPDEKSKNSDTSQAPSGTPIGAPAVGDGSESTPPVSATPPAEASVPAISVPGGKFAGPLIVPGISESTEVSPAEAERAVPPAAARSVSNDLQPEAKSLEVEKTTLEPQA